MRGDLVNIIVLTISISAVMFFAFFAFFPHLKRVINNVPSLNSDLQKSFDRLCKFIVLCDPYCFIQSKQNKTILIVDESSNELIEFVVGCRKYETYLLLYC